MIFDDHSNMIINVIIDSIARCEQEQALKTQIIFLALSRNVKTRFWGIIR